MIESIKHSLVEAQSALDAFIANEPALAAVERAAGQLIATLENGGRIYSCGNGGSMCDAMHFAEELTGRYRGNRPGMAAIAISDPSHISCVANDFGYEQIFARYLESHGRAGDTLIAISTSGKSPTILNAATKARELGVNVIALTGRPASPLAPLADIEICAPGGQYADRVQELHIKVLHILIELIERHFFPENYLP
ncbi:SIS domain-containing protein [Phytohalomonas tamaricis]|uniref:SIS domain-containing protein n=1 Tax=Phytohalomonas tamaricis TaxID=2081032 RepID=UPI000D0B919B|nr:SIS domain-containing protein [Phytohalomonas tamaricis]